MYFPRYFKLGQNIRLERVFLDPARQNQADSLSGQIASCSSSEFVIHFPYGRGENHVAYPFFPGMPFEIHAEYHGLGIKVSATFEEQLATGLIRMLPAGELEFYYKREHPRVSRHVWVGCQRDSGSLLSMRRQWRRQVDRFRFGQDPSTLTAFAKKKIELGDDGVNLELEAPVKISDLILVYLAIDDGKPVVSTLAEVVWAEPAAENNQQITGLHFINILDDDRKRIKRAIRDTRS